MTAAPLLRAATVALAAAASVACSPALNWREVRIKQLVAMLPCKPDHAERTVRLAAQEVTLQVSGCEAAGALYAISHLQVAEAAQLEPVRRAWREATLDTLQATAPASASASLLGSQAETVTGKRPDGATLQAQLMWRVQGRDLYQVAVYGPKLDAPMTELLFSELRLP